jgi:hypothetical protein
MGFGLVIGFIGPLKLANTGNYNTNTNVHSKQITVAHAESQSITS